MQKNQRRNSTRSIGLVTKSTAEEYFKSADTTMRKYAFCDTYSTYAHLSGLDVYPILLNKSREEIRSILLKVNGVLFPGGMTNVLCNSLKNHEVLSQFSKTVKIIMEEAKALNDKGDYFPVFGICLGFEAMILVESDDMSIIEKRPGGLGYNEPLIYTLKPQESRFLSYFPPDLIDYMSKANCTYNYHDYIVDHNKLVNNTKVSNIYKVVSLSKSEDKSFSFVSVIEGKKYPFYGMQFHPELAVGSYPIAGKGYSEPNKAAEVSRGIMWLMLRETNKNFHSLSDDDKKKLLVNNPGTILHDAHSGLSYHSWD